MTDQPIPAEGPALSDAAPEKRRIPLIAKVYGVLCILSSTAVLTIAAIIAVGFVWAFIHGGVDIDIRGC